MNDSVCELCGGAAMVSVPHPAFIEGGEWCFNGTYQPTAAVLCSCGLGRKIAESQGGEVAANRMMTLAEYESHVPRDLWRSLFADKHKRDLEYRRPGARA